MNHNSQNNLITKDEIEKKTKKKGRRLGCGRVKLKKRRTKSE